MDISKTTKLKLYAMMLRIRLFEEKIIELYPEREMRCPVHLCIGQEAVPAGICANLEKDDYVWSTHRGHGHYIAKGGSLEGLAAELYGKITGCAKGKGGSMHLVDTAAGIPGTTAIVGASAPLAVGAALAFKIRKEKKISVAFFGDGATDEGAFYESMNFAGLKKLPVVFVCENNFYATNSNQSARQALDNIHKKAGLFDVPGKRIDGNNVLDIYETAKETVEKARSGKGPALLECRTYRWKGHVGITCDYIKGCRPKEELDEWLKKCPLEKYENMLEKEGLLKEKNKQDIKNKISEEIASAFEFAKKSPFPDKKELLTDIF